MAEAQDKVFLHGLAFYGYHGVRPEERSQGQRFQVDVEVSANVRAAAASDDLKDTVNYAQVLRLVREVMEGEPKNLMETLAEEIAQRVLDSPPTQAVRVRVTKVSPPLHGASAGLAGVEVSRSR